MKEQTAQELARHYLKECKTMTVMRYGSLLIFLFLLVSFWSKLNIIFAGILVSLFYLSLRFLRNMKRQQLTMVQNILWEDCDPDRYAAVMELLAAESKQDKPFFNLCRIQGLCAAGRMQEAAHALDLCDPDRYAAVMELLAAESKQDKPFFNLCRIQGLCAAGRMQEAAHALDLVYIQRADLGIQLLYLRCAFDSHLFLGELETARRLRQETADLIQKNRPGQQPAIQRVLRMMDASLALAEHRWEESRALETQIYDEAFNPYQLASSAYRLGRAELADGEIESGKAHLQEAVSKGGRLYAAAEAKRLLESASPAPSGVPEEDGGTLE